MEVLYFEVFKWLTPLFRFAMLESWITDASLLKPHNVTLTCPTELQYMKKKEWLH